MRLLRHIKKHPALYHFLRQGVYARIQSARRRKIFLQAYKTNLWGDGSSVSGPGSSLIATSRLRQALPELLANLGVKSILDIPCGDFEWMQHVSLGVEKYTGIDIVHPIIERNREKFSKFGEFLCCDLLRDPLPHVDAVFCRDCLVHLSYREVLLAIDNIRRSKSTYLIMTTFPDIAENADTVSPYWRPINFQIEPFNCPAPIYLIEECAGSHPNDQGKCMGVWRCADL